MIAKTSYKIELDAAVYAYVELNYSNDTTQRSNILGFSSRSLCLRE